MPEPSTVWVFAQEEEASRSPDERPLQARRQTRAPVQKVELPFGSLQESMRDFLDAAHGLLAQEFDRAGGFAVDSVEVAAQISADGKVGFLGTSVGLGGQASLKFVFKRTASAAADG
jgi:hypothetical protein